MTLTLNINDSIRFRLTPHGENIFDAHWGKSANVMRGDRGRGAQVKMQVHAFANIFGPHLYMAAEQIVVDNNISIAWETL